MEKNVEKLKEYVAMNEKYWTWTPGKYHEVVFLGFEVTEFQFKTGGKVSTIRYHFQFSDGKQKPCDIRSLTFAKKMTQFTSGDRLKLRRNSVGEKKYEYEVSKIE